MLSELCALVANATPQAGQVYVRRGEAGRANLPEDFLHSWRRSAAQLRSAALLATQGRRFAPRYVPLPPPEPVETVLRQLNAVFGGMDDE